MQEKEKEEFQEVILEDESTKCIEVSYRISALINQEKIPSKYLRLRPFPLKSQAE